jgi:hypothetical protein
VPEFEIPAEESSEEETSISIIEENSKESGGSGNENDHPFMNDIEL